MVNYLTVLQVHIILTSKNTKYINPMTGLIMFMLKQVEYLSNNIIPPKKNKCKLYKYYFDCWTFSTKFLLL